MVFSMCFCLSLSLNVSPTFSGSVRTVLVTASCSRAICNFLQFPVFRAWRSTFSKRAIGILHFYRPTALYPAGHFVAFLIVERDPATLDFHTSWSDVFWNILNLSHQFWRSCIDCFLKISELKGLWFHLNIIIPKRRNHLSRPRRGLGKKPRCLIVTKFQSMGLTWILQPKIANCFRFPKACFKVIRSSWASFQGSEFLDRLSLWSIFWNLFWTFPSLKCNLVTFVHAFSACFAPHHLAYSSIYSLFSQFVWICSLFRSGLCHHST